MKIDKRYQKQKKQKKKFEPTYNFENYTKEQSKGLSDISFPIYIGVSIGVYVGLILSIIIYYN